MRRTLLVVGALSSGIVGCSDSQSIVGRRDSTVDTGADVPVIDTPPPQDVVDAMVLPDISVPMDVPPDGPPMATSRVIAVCGTVCKRPTDAVPNSLGTVVFFTAYTPEGAAAVFRVTVPPAGAPPAVPVLLAFGGGLELLTGIALSNNDSTIFLADPAATRGDVEGIGSLYTVSAAGGTPTQIALPAEVLNPSSVAVTNNAMELLFSARQATATEVRGALFRMPVGGGMATVVTTDVIDPSGVAQSASGDIQVFDARRGGPTSGSAVTVMAMAMTVAESTANLVTRYPAGIAYALDGRGTILSGADPGVGEGLLTWMGADGRPTAPAALSMGMDSPAGLHRARTANVVAVADQTAGNNGSVFLVALP